MLWQDARVVIEVSVVDFVVVLQPFAVVVKVVFC